MYVTWNRMIDELELEESELEADVLGRRPRLGPDAWAISWSSRQILMLDLTRAHDWHQEWSIATHESRIGRYTRLREEMQGLLPTGWRVETIPLTVGIRGSLQVSTWVRLLYRFGVALGPPRSAFCRTLPSRCWRNLTNCMGSAAQRTNRLNMSGEIKVKLSAQPAAGQGNCLLSTAPSLWREMRSAWTDAAAYARSDVDFAFLSIAPGWRREMRSVWMEAAAYARSDVDFAFLSAGGGKRDLLGWKLSLTLGLCPLFHLHTSC